MILNLGYVVGDGGGSGSGSGSGNGSCGSGDSGCRGGRFANVVNYAADDGCVITYFFTMQLSIIQTTKYE